jgi:hypothetical protein
MIGFVAPLLFAQDSPLTHMGSHFRKGSENFTSQDMLILSTVVTVLAVSIWLLSRIFYGREPRALNSPRALFRELCRAHRLDSSSKRLLFDLARVHNLDHPARLFIEPERFAEPNLGPQLNSRRDELRALAERLFG